MSRGDDDENRFKRAEHIHSACFDEDQVLLARISASEVDALDTLIRSYAHRLEASAFLIVRRSDLAQDVVQDVFIKLWEQRHTLNIQKSVANYLFRAVRFRAISLVRHESAEHRAEESLRDMLMIAPPFDMNAGSVNIDTQEFAHIVRDVLRELPPRCREIFLMHRVAGMSYVEIADTLEIGLATVRNQMSRATRALSDALRRLDLF